jgi:16S rRNA (guanine(966)-N(2))-methyltransferase RsmD
MRAQIRIVSGSLRGRKVACVVTPELRPTPDKVREALFSILGNAVPGRAFVDVFAGTGVMGMEALSRGASEAMFVERDIRLAGDIERHLQQFKVDRQARMYRTDAYRWASHWQAPPEPVNFFISPPFIDLEERSDSMVQMLIDLKAKLAPDSCLILQSERLAPMEALPIFKDWEKRTYGRNVLFLWQRELPGAGAPVTVDDSEYFQ